ncbi:hypothetical protein RHMOL_Rhmol02G0010800 [Rhododendron molle]|uniref:Uncharacterized protein n=1 Tax=Rhododendron molle TaxID=49168 RepID=A0ACC0PMN5_RHOML|nr:hypothetical protein RHMOL_Rhmol02G0010800 [Rhododendron molle]
MAYRRLEINVISAKDLKKVNLIGKTHAYAVVWLSGDLRASKQQRTAVDRSGNVSPTWNSPVEFAVEVSAARSNHLGVTFRIRCKRTLGDKDIGEVYVPLSDLIGPTEDGELLQSVTYQVRRPWGKPNKGELKFTYKWGEKMASAPAMEVNMYQEPVTADPAQVGPGPVSPPPPTGYLYQLPGKSYPSFSAAGCSYPPPQPGYYGYPPPPPCYVYPPGQQPQKNHWLAKLLGVELGKCFIGDAQDYKKTARQIRRKMMYKKMKTKLVVIGILLVLALTIWVSVCRGFHCTK